MKKSVLTVFISLFVLALSAQTPDPPLSPAQAVSMLGKGILMEPQAGNVNIGFSAPYKPAYGDSLVAAGYQSVRIRYQGDNNPMMQAIADGPPYDAADDALLDQTDSIITDLLNKNLGVVLTFYGLTKDNPGDLHKMAAWWGYVANRFKNKSHRLIFDLFVEPWTLVHNSDPHRIMDYYDSITAEIRKTNPDRIIIYFKIPPADASSNPYGPGTKYFMTQAYNPVPKEAGRYFMWDFHVLKPDARDNIRLVEQAWEYMDSTKQVVWSGAWNAKNTDNEMWVARPIAYQVTRRFIDRGIPSAYLMFFDGATSLFDAEMDRNHNGKTGEWLYPGFQKIMTEGPSVWWNMLSNPGFEDGMKKWTVTGGNYTIELKNENHFLQFPAATDGHIALSQDVTLALKNNGPGVYDVLAYVSSQGTSTVQFVLEGSAGGGSFSDASTVKTVQKGHPVLLHLKINAGWDGTLQNAVFSIRTIGDAVTIDKTGLTQFFYKNPKLNISLWPGERLHHDSYSFKSNSVQDINGQLRSLMNKSITAGNSTVKALADSINTVTRQLEDRLIQLIGSDYQYTSEGTQYRLGGYYQGTANSQYRNLVDRYISGKDATAYQLNNKLISFQNQSRDYFIFNNLDFRELFYDVYRGYPTEVRQKIPVDTTVTVTGSTLTANQSGADYRWCDCNNLYNPVNGATSQSFTPDSSGNYAVQITLNGYTVTSACYPTDITGIRPAHTPAGVKIYPNPAHDYFVLHTEKKQGPFQLKIRDVQGRLIKTFSGLYPPEVKISLPFPSGIYFGEVLFANQKSSFKIIKE